MITVFNEEIIMEYIKQNNQGGEVMSLNRSILQKCDPVNAIELYAQDIALSCMSQRIRRRWNRGR